MKQKNELRTEYLGINALNFGSAHNSPSRAYMFSGHFAQRLVTIESDEPIVQTGVEPDIAKYVFNVKMPKDGRIIEVIKRYPKTHNVDSINYNPESVVIYEDKDGVVDYFSIVHYKSLHQFFGYELVPNEENLAKIKPGAYIQEGTIFAEAPSVSENGGYKYGLNLNIAMASLPDCSEDGIAISRDVLDRLSFKIYETRTVEFGSKKFPLNLFGSKNDYRPFREIGEYLPDDGLLMSCREYDTLMAPVEISMFDVMEPDFMFDSQTYSRAGQGKIVDIKVISNGNRNKQLPVEMTSLLEKYRNALVTYYENIVATEKKLRLDYKRRYGRDGLKLSPKLHRLVVDAMVMLDHKTNNGPQLLNLLYRKTPVDEYRVEFVIEYIMAPNMGFKLSDRSGSVSKRSA
jgi:hypothetical protein